jgi:DNA processing protein
MTTDPGRLAERNAEPAMDRTGERIARAGLSRVVEPGDAAATDVLAGLPAAEAWDRMRRGGSRHEQWAGRLAAADPARDLDQVEAAGGRFVIPGDDEWPDQLEVLASSGELNRRGGLPFGLWARGPASLRELSARSVAVVGARACSAYGEHVAGELAAGLADDGVTVVSGGAYGIDAAAHRGALAGSGPTIAVLAGGADVSYPRGNAALFDRIVTDGLVVSELPPGCSPTRLRFLARNRLIAALTAGTVVVEAAARSGALNTASWAERCNRQVMAVPGPITSASSHGPHILVREKGALLVTGVADILEAVAPLGQHLTRYPRGEERPTDRLSELAQRVLDAVPVNAGAPEHSIGRTAGLAADAVRTGLVELTRAGLVEQLGTGWRLSADRREALL